MKTKLLRSDVEFFIEEQYPLTVLTDRYNGCYSGAKFLAFPRDHFDIEEEVAGDDGECRHYWDTFDDLVGKGNTLQAAVDDLMAKMKQEAADGFVHCTTIEERLGTLDLTLPEALQIVNRNAEDTPSVEPSYPVGGISGEERFRKHPLELVLNKEQQEKLAERFKENDGPVHHVSGNAIVNLFGKFKKKPDEEKVTKTKNRQRGPQCAVRRRGLHPGKNERGAAEANGQRPGEGVNPAQGFACLVNAKPQKL